MWDPYARLLTVDEAAESIGRPPSTVRRWISEGKLAPYAVLNSHRKLYLEADVHAADAAAHRARHRRGVGDNK